MPGVTTRLLVGLLSLAAVTVVGCTTTETLSTPSNPKADLQQIPEGEKLRVGMADGTVFTALSVRVAGDSLYLLLEVAPPDTRSVHRTDVTHVSKRRVDAARTVGLVALTVGALALVGALFGDDGGEDCWPLCDAFDDWEW